jgi:hypothetical protein
MEKLFPNWDCDSSGDTTTQLFQLNTFLATSEKKDFSAFVLLARFEMIALKA